jgi:hypothetical protein
VLHLALHILDGAREFERLLGLLPKDMERKPLGAAAADARHRGEGLDQAAHGIGIGGVRHDGLLR